MNEQVLQIRHIGYKDDKPQFEVVRLPDGKSTPLFNGAIERRLLEYKIA